MNQNEVSPEIEAKVKEIYELTQTGASKDELIASVDMYIHSLMVSDYDDKTVIKGMRRLLVDYQVNLPVDELTKWEGFCDRYIDTLRVEGE